MSSIPVIFGTESGNAEMVADDIVAAIAAADLEAEAVPMEDVTVDDLARWPLMVLVTSTYGEGDLPATTAPFHETLMTQRPDLAHLRFAAFGLGDSTYETYNNAVSVLAEALAALGATRIGEIGRHDASSGESFTAVATLWAGKLIAEL